MRRLLLSLVIVLMPMLSAGSAGAAAESDEFLYWASDTAMAGEQLAALACAKAQDDAIKAFACRLRADQQQAIDRLSALARARDASPPTTVSKAEEDIEHDLRPLAGEVFDYYYMRDAVSALTRAMLLYESAARQAQDARVLGYVAERLPALQQIYDQARHAQARLPSTAPPLWGAAISNEHQPTAGPAVSFEGY